MSETDDTQRLDKWLWFVRLVKTRSLATQLVNSGKVRVNETRINKPAYKLKIGDIITTTIAHQPRVYKVLAAGERRGPAKEAVALYEDLSPPPVSRKKPETPINEDDERHKRLTSGPTPTRPKGTGRPTKKDRRAMNKFEDQG